jgi:glutamate dehydrogenase
MKSLEDIAGKTSLESQDLKKIEDIILGHEHFSKEAIRKEMELFFTQLGLPEYYFKTTPLKTIAMHIEAVKSSEVMASVREDKDLIIDMRTESDDEAIYLVDDEHDRALEVEKRIEMKYPNFRIHSYRTSGKALGREHLRMYLVYRPKIDMSASLPEETDLDKIAGKGFLDTATHEAKERYQRVLEKTVGWETPLIEGSHKRETNELRIIIVTSRDSSSSFFSNVSDVINSHGLVSKRKYTEQFRNGKTVYAIYMENIEDKQKIADLIVDLSLVYVIPQSPLSGLFREGKLTAQEMVFGVSAWSFAHQFLSGCNEEYLKLSEVLKDSPEMMGILRNLKTKLAKDTYTESAVWDSLVQNYPYVKHIFSIFDKRFSPYQKDHDIKTDLEELGKEMKRLPTNQDRDIFNACIQFVKVIQRTNFYKQEKTSIAFMCDPAFLNGVDYPEMPFQVFQVIGLEFRGFHVRFRDVARGGIRIVRSIDYQTYINNSDFIFDENYNLALTQQKKNKDIPEGGSKGTILLRWGYQDKSETAFKKYINGLLDLMLPDNQIVDFYGKEVILFMGPDEGTADLMEWASYRARKMRYPHWKAFSTGKPVRMGGIPHDLYGMTTNSVHRYVIKTLEKLGLKEENITKVMTGGPDGDLGSNEILISKDQICAMVDGSGVLYDPAGINRDELKRLAKARKMVENFNTKLLSENGFLVTIKENDVTLPGGEKVESGLELRNFFHLNPIFKGDLFVPCGGRPASININNWKKFIDDEGRPRFKVISEGANLFITQEARLRLEENGVIIFKDASANKGGVTSSSMEVFASLALSDEEYDQLMTVKDENIPDFRRTYIEEILDLIRNNADMEFDVIEREKAKNDTPRAILSDLVSKKINLVTDAVYASDLHKDKDLFKNVIKRSCPAVLMKAIGFEKVLERVPDIYLRAVFASRLASRYVYSFGLDANEIDFHKYIESHRRMEFEEGK